MTLLFPDVSSYTPNVDPARYPALIARATLSDRVADPTYQGFKAKAAAAGTVFAAYHWLNHGNLQRQAQWAFQHVGGNVPLMIDAEDVAGNTGYNGPLTIDDITGFAAAYRALGGIVSLCYLPFWYWSGAMGAPRRLGELAAAGLGLVSSNYPNAGYTDNGPGWAVYYPGAPKPVQWQYTSTPIDMNAFKGTVAEYAALIGIPQVKDESIEVTGMPFLAIDTATGAVYLCTDDFKSHHIPTPELVSDIVRQYVWGTRVLAVAGSSTPAGTTKEWDGVAGVIWVGWAPETCGPVDEPVPVAITDAQLDTLAQKVAALMPKPPTADENAKAVLDAEAQRLQS